MSDLYINSVLAKNKELDEKLEKLEIHCELKDRWINAAVSILYRLCEEYDNASPRNHPMADEICSLGSASVSIRGDSTDMCIAQHDAGVIKRMLEKAPVNLFYDSSYINSKWVKDYADSLVKQASGGGNGSTIIDV